MGPKECLGFIQAILLPDTVERYIVIRVPSTDIVYCQAIIKVIFRLSGDKVLAATGQAPMVGDAEKKAIADVLSGENKDPNAEEALKNAGLTMDKILDAIKDNPDLAGIFLNNFKLFILI